MHRRDFLESNNQLTGKSSNPVYETFIKEGHPLNILSCLLLPHVSNPSIQTSQRSFHKKMLPHYYLHCKCGKQLVPSDQVCHLAIDKMKHMTLRPNYQIQLDPMNNPLPSSFSLLQTMTPSDPKKKNNMVVKQLDCKNCGEKVASVIKCTDSTGDNLFLVAFRPEQTYFSPFEIKQDMDKKKWHERVQSKPSMVMSMKWDDYEKERKEMSILLEDDEEDVPREKIQSEFFSEEKARLDENYLFPPTLECSDVREYQVEMYYQCLLGNAIISLPTGLGKTLVAILLMKKYHEMNNGKKLIGFVVNRIPLAFHR